MELDLWNEDFLLSQEWALEIPDVKISGHLDDQGSSNRPKGVANDLLFQDASTFEAFNREDVLGLDWMESTDIGSLLACLGDDQDSKLPLQESNVVDFNSPDLIQQVDWIEDSPVTNVHSTQLPSVLGTDSFLSPPESPDSTIAVSNIVTDAISEIDVETVSPVLDYEQNILTLTGVDIYNDVASICNGLPESSIFVGDAATADVSFAVPSSPDSSSQASQSSSIIESSPELYKVICTAPASNRFSPYTTSSPKQQRKKTTTSKSRKRQPAQPVPEHVIMEQLDKKDRKKLQNKNAAIRYRMKKKEEAVDIVGEEKQLEDVNMKLKTKVEDLQREIKYMKNLMEDVLRAKGIHT